MSWLDIGVAAVTGLLSGAVGSVIAPWSQWGVEKKRGQRAARVQRVALWREGVANLRQAEQQASPLFPISGGPEMEAGFIRVDAGSPAPDPRAIGPQGWFITLNSEISTTARAEMARLLRQHRSADRGTELSDLLELEIARIEREVWSLI